MGPALRKLESSVYIFGASAAAYFRSPKGYFVNHHIHPVRMQILPVKLTE
jgi:hypothetical protein